MNVKSYNTKDYENIANWTLGENKPKTNPIQTQSNPICLKAKMDVTLYVIKDYERNDIFAVPENKPNSNPIQTQSKPVLSAVEWANFRTLFPLTARPVRRKTLSSNGAGDYNGIFSQTSYFKTTPIERV